MLELFLPITDVLVLKARRKKANTTVSYSAHKHSYKAFYVNDLLQTISSSRTWLKAWRSHPSATWRWVVRHTRVTPTWKRSSNKRLSTQSPRAASLVSEFAAWEFSNAPIRATLSVTSLGAHAWRTVIWKSKSNAYIISIETASNPRPVLWSRFWRTVIVWDTKLHVLSCLNWKRSSPTSRHKRTSDSSAALFFWSTRVLTKARLKLL